MTGQAEGEHSKVWQSLQVLSRKEGTGRPNLIEALKGELSELRRVWHIDLEKDVEDVRRAIRGYLHALIVQLTPRDARQELSPEQRKKQYSYAVAVSFNLFDDPELRGSNLQDRRSWLASKDQGLLQIAVTTSQRDLNHAIDQMERILTRSNGQPVQDHSGEIVEILSAPEDSMQDCTGRADAASAPQPMPEVLPQRRHRGGRLSRVGATIIIVCAVLAAAAGIGVAVELPDQNPAPKTDNTGAASANPGNTTRALAVASSWPYITGCPSLAQVAMPPGMGRIQDFHAVTDVRPTLAASGAGSWSRGMLYLDLSTVNGQSVHIQNILPHRTRLDLASPAWIYTPDDGCGPPLSNRAFSFDLDAPSFKDMGVAYGDSSSPPAGVVPPTAPLGPGFIVSGAEHALIEVDASSCHGNYEWNLDIQYVVTGSDKVEHYLEGPFQSYGVANNTDVYHGHQDPTGSIQIDDVSKLTGSAQC